MLPQPSESESYRALHESKILVLTGAGASAPFGMPTMDCFHDLIDKEFQPFADKIIKGCTDAENDLEFLLGRLTVYETLAGERAKDHNLRNWFQVPDNTPLQSATMLRSHIFSAIVRKYGRLTEQNADTARSILRPLLDGLHKLAGNKPSVLPLFTLNYDLVLEQVLLDYVDASGFCVGLGGGWFEQRWRFETYVKQEYRFAIFRLHGCSHWMRERRSGEIFFQPLPDTEGRDFREPCVLYPIPGKESRLTEEPFRSAYEEFRLCLKGARVLVLIGYSGRDPSVQAALEDALLTDPTKVLIVITKGDELRPGLLALKRKAPWFKHLTGGIESSTSEIIRICSNPESIMQLEPPPGTLKHIEPPPVSVS